MLAVEYLQSRGPNCPVTSALLDMMARDSSPDVRKCIINKIGLSDASIAGNRTTQPEHVKCHREVSSTLLIRTCPKGVLYSEPAL